ncbi:hypothetical protein OC842_000624 [Tilletia horrida]|uniref:Peptidase A1 domain-containing protein n=1 Tax=Tilletia horrida TaxID=155126 RepID=A0AAN6GH41_9BASI|nr:hypothetical protein OC842_000624 [Tilletia horrida]
MKLTTPTLFAALMLATSSCSAFMMPLKPRNMARDPNAQIDMAADARHGQHLVRKHSRRSSTAHKRTEIPLQFFPERIGWTTTMIVGGQKLKAYIDTGSGDLITDGPAYDPTKSRTARDTGIQFESSLGGIPALGEVWNDTVEIGGLKVPSVPVGYTNGTNWDSGTEDMVAGFSPNFDGSSMFSDTSMPLPYYLHQAGAIREAVFALAVSEDSGELTLGEINLARAKGSIEYFPRLSADADWDLQGSFLGQNVRMTIDSGAAVVHLALPFLKKVIGKVPGVTIVQAPGDPDIYWVAYDCKKPPAPFSFTFGSTTITLRKELMRDGTLEDGRCVLPIQGLTGTPPASSTMKTTIRMTALAALFVSASATSFSFQPITARDLEDLVATNDLMRREEMNQLANSVILVRAEDFANSAFDQPAVQRRSAQPAYSLEDVLSSRDLMNEVLRQRREAEAEKAVFDRRGMGCFKGGCFGGKPKTDSPKSASSYGENDSRTHGFASQMLDHGRNSLGRITEGSERDSPDTEASFKTAKTRFGHEASSSGQTGGQQRKGSGGASGSGTRRLGPKSKSNQW